MTILQALDRYYERMAARGEAEAPGWSREKISYVIILSAAGEPLDVTDLRDAQGSKSIPRLMEAPKAVKRTVGIAPDFLWDKTAYVLGLTAGEGRRTAEEHARFRVHHLEQLAGETNAGLVALRRFIEAWKPQRFADYAVTIDRDAAPDGVEIIER